MVHIPAKKYKVRPARAELASRLWQIAKIIQAVERRCESADGPVADTRAEMTPEEMRKIYKLASART